MADVDAASAKKGSQAEKPDKKSFLGRFLPWIIIGGVVAAGAGAGFGLGRLLAGPRVPSANETSPQPDDADQTPDLSSDETSGKDSGKVWYYDMEPVIANLNEPGVSRYVRATFTLEISSETDQKKGTAFLDEKKPILRDMLFVYLSGLSLKDIQGDKNLKSIQSRIRELFNEKLFPDSKPQITRVLIKEFPVQ